MQGERMQPCKNNPVCNGIYCAQVPPMQCNNVPKEKCWDEPRQPCKQVPQEKIGIKTWSSMSVCSQDGVPGCSKKCWDEPRQESHDVPR